MDDNGRFIIVDNRTGEVHPASDDIEAEYMLGDLISNGREEDDFQLFEVGKEWDFKVAYKNNEENVVELIQPLY